MVTKAQAVVQVLRVGMGLASFPGSKRRRRKDLVLLLLFGSGNEASLGPNPECLIYPPLPMVLLGNHNLGLNTVYVVVMNMDLNTIVVVNTCFLRVILVSPTYKDMHIHRNIHSHPSQSFLKSTLS